MMSVVRILFILFCLLVSACGSLVGEEEEVVDPPAELVDIETSLDVDELWDRDTGKGTNDEYLRLQPVVAGDRVYVADIGRKILALNTENGRNIWSFEPKFEGGSFFSKADNVFITGGPGFGEGSVIIGTSKGDVISVDAETGKQQWSSKVTSEVLSAPQKSGNIVVVRSLDGRIFGLNGDNGRRLWSYDMTVPTLSLRGTGTPLVEGGVIIDGFDNGSLIALEATSGRLLWETNIATPSGRSDLERLVDIDSPPMVVGGIVYTAAFQGQLAALTLDTGRMLWNRQISTYSGFTVEGDILYLTDDKSNVWAFDRYNGGSVWKQDGLLNRQVTAPAVVGNYLVMGDFEGYIHWLDKYTGAFVARQRIARDRIIAEPVVSGDVVYAYATNGELSALTYR